MDNYTQYIERFSRPIEELPGDLPVAGPLPPSLLMEKRGDLETYYAPFDAATEGAKVVIVGLTPGIQQAAIALNAAREALLNGRSTAEAVRRGKESGAFAGALRNNLVAMLDHIHLPELLGLDSASALFGESAHLVHKTSALRYPVLFKGQNYSGTPAVLGVPALRSQVERYLAEDLQAHPGAWVVPLGTQAKAAVSHLVSGGVVHVDRILDGLPHPSGANSERIAYFLGRKPRQNLSSKVNPDTIDRDKVRLLEQLKAAGDVAQTTPPPAVPLPTGEPMVMSLTAGNINNAHIYLRPWIQYFPKSVVGGSNKSQLAAEKLTFVLPCGFAFESDIDGAKKMIRNRKDVAKLFKLYGLEAGARLRLQWEGARTVRLTPL